MHNEIKETKNKVIKTNKNFKITKISCSSDRLESSS